MLLALGGDGFGDRHRLHQAYEGQHHCSRKQLGHDVEVDPGKPDGGQPAWNITHYLAIEAQGPGAERGYGHGHEDLPVAATEPNEDCGGEGGDAEGGRVDPGDRGADDINHCLVVILPAFRSYSENVGQLRCGDDYGGGIGKADDHGGGEEIHQVAQAQYAHE